MTMLRIRSAAFIAALAGLLHSAAASAAPADTTATLYALTTPPSSLQAGCFGPCECPIQLEDTFGSFELVPLGVDPLFTNYAVRNFIASFNNGPGAVSIIGSGHFRVGGEVALTQQLTLDLSIEGRAEHFDSGSVPVKAPFPQIDVTCAVHAFACMDSVIEVGARPATVGVPPAPRATVATITAVRPNPFRTGAAISWTLPRGGAIDLTIVDLEGRLVRRLVHESAAGAGAASVTWDGRHDDGRAAAAGVYWVVLRGADGSDRRRIVKLE
jgi:hypothetical protein